MTEGGPRPYELRVAGPAARELERLSENIATAIVEFMLGPLLDTPHRIGGPLRRDLEGLRSARRGAYRVVYEIDEEASVVIVLRIDHRSSIYRRR